MRRASISEAHRAMWSQRIQISRERSRSDGAMRGAAHRLLPPYTAWPARLVLSHALSIIARRRSLEERFDTDQGNVEVFQTVMGRRH